MSYQDVGYERSGDRRGALDTWSPLRGLFGTSMPPSLTRGFGEMLGAGIRDLSVPPMDIRESKDAYLVEVELPGVKKEGVTVECQEDVLTIRAEKRAQRAEEDERALLLERAYGMFTRSVRLPSDADTDQVSAHFEDGVLRVEIRKSPESKPKIIEIDG